MNSFSRFIKMMNPFTSFSLGYGMKSNKIFQKGKQATLEEKEKTTKRHEVINFLLNQFHRETTYLEIGVRNPNDNFNVINASNKYSVDPGIEFEANSIDFKMTSDAFFEQLSSGKVLSKDIKFDVVFIDGLHLAEQVDKDIANALHYLKEDGFVVLHDCNPPTEWHAREDYYYKFTPAAGSWNGTTWKAFIKWRSSNLVSSCCIDSDWGIGVISKQKRIGNSIPFENKFYEYKNLENNRKKQLNLFSFNDFKKML